MQLKVDGYGITDPLGSVKNFRRSRINACYNIWGTILILVLGRLLAFINQIVRELESQRVRESESQGVRECRPYCLTL